jgi:LysR family transcriptional regulator, hypochlorite-specific transcription factor HypT
METRWLDDFIALADCRNFTRAAELRHSSQSAFSRRIRALEEWVGATLVDREGSPVDLTKAGERFLVMAGGLRGALDAARYIGRSPVGEGIPRVTVLLQAGLNPVILANLLLRDGCAQLPWRTITQTVSWCESLVRMDRGTADALLYQDCDSIPLEVDQGRFEVRRLAQDTLVLCGSAALVHSASGLVSRARCRPWPHIEHAPASYLAQMAALATATRTSERFLQPICQVDNVDAALAMLRAGVGVAWIPSSYIAAEMRSGGIVQIDPQCKLDLNVKVLQPSRVSGALGPPGRLDLLDHLWINPAVLRFTAEA